METVVTIKQATIVHCKRQPYDVYIGRPSKWGNPFKIGCDGDRQEVITKYEEWLLGIITAPDGSKPPSLKEALTELSGKRLGCWCFPAPCHGDVLLRFVNRSREEEL
jgi:hypothetical protein